jgi:hypothetical protein
LTDFSAEIRRRVQDARQQISEAMAGGDEYLAQVLQGELDALRRIADENHVAVD